MKSKNGHQKSHARRFDKPRETPSIPPPLPYKYFKSKIRYLRYGILEMYTGPGPDPQTPGNRYQVPGTWYECTSHALAQSQWRIYMHIYLYIYIYTRIHAYTYLRIRLYKCVLMCVLNDRSHLGSRL